MKFYELEIDSKTYKLRLTSSNAVALEKKTGVKILDLVQDYSVTTILTVLEYMCKNEENNNQFSSKEASSLYDKLVDNGYTMYDIVFKVIYEGLVAGGFLTHEELEEMTENANAKKENLKEEALEK